LAGDGRAAWFRKKTLERESLLSREPLFFQAFCVFGRRNSFVSGLILRVMEIILAVDVLICATGDIGKSAFERYIAVRGCKPRKRRLRVP